MDDIEKLRLFLWRAEEMRQTRLVRKGFKSGLRISQERHGPIKFEMSEPDEEDLRSFLLTFRQFVSKGEPVYLQHIFNICRKRLTSEKLRDELVQAREDWKSSHRAAGIKLVFNEHLLTPEVVLDIWINGQYFHSDPGKRNFLFRILPHERMLTRINFFGFIVKGIEQVLFVSEVITISFKEGLLA